MKNYTLLLVLLFISASMFAQSKPKQKEVAPTQKEMEAMMKEAQKTIDNIDPKTKKMMDSMGIKMPSFNAIPQATDKQLAAAWEDDDKVVPSKKTDLISRLPKKILTTAEVSSFIKNTNISIAGMINPKSKDLAEKTISQFKTDPFYGGMIASSANGMWIMGLKEPAIYLMGKAAEVLPNADNYNNYAAYLTMMGAAHMAIPVLEKLNRVHKNNSTILNNLGQAWLQLGDVVKAENYLDSAIRIYAYHPQANYTKCLILESEGKTTEAVVALKRSLKHSVTKSKLDKLSKLEKNRKTKPKYYIPRTYFSTSFNLGLYTAALPTSYSMSVGTTIQKEWDFAKQQLNDELHGLDAAIRMADQKAKGELNKLQTKVTKYRNVDFSPYYYKALTASPPSTMTDERKFENEAKEGVDYLIQLGKLKSEFSHALEMNQEQNKTMDCGDVSVVNKYIPAINNLNQAYRERKLKEWATDAYANYNYETSIATTDGVALKEVLEIKRDFVSKLLSLNHESYDLPGCAQKTEEKKLNKRKLPDYDKINCKTASSLYVPLTGQITIRCNEMDVVFNPTYLPVKASWTEDFNADRIQEASIGVTIKAVDLTLSGKRDDDGNIESGKISIGKNIKGIDVSVNGDFDANGFTKGSVELGVDGSMSLIPKSMAEAAPVDISLKGKLGVGLELGAEGITDMYVKESTSLDVASSIEADFKTSGDETKGLINEIASGADIQLQAPKVGAGASISADNRIGVNSGYSGKTSSSISGIRIK